jgi:hypothetical protein
MSGFAAAVEFDGCKEGRVEGIISANNRRGVVAKASATVTSRNNRL